MNKINNILVYNSSMDKSLYDKEWFTKMVDADIFVDFGCANGNLIKHLSSVYKNSIFIGYDLSQDMINIAKKNCKLIPNAHFTTNWNFIKGIISNERNKKTCLILSSVIHEVYSYGDNKSINNFWNIISSGLFSYIAIRDMSFNNNFDLVQTSKNIYKESLKSDYLRIKLNEFEKVWGDISSSHKILTEFLLKYRYDANWDREVLETYLPIEYNDMFLFNKFTKYGYFNEYKETYTLEFLKRTFKKDFKIDFSGNTHIKLLFIK